MELRNSRRSKTVMSAEKPRPSSTVDVELVTEEHHFTKESVTKDRYFFLKPRSSLRINDEWEQQKEDIFEKTLKLSFFGSAIGHKRSEEPFGEPKTSVLDGFHFKNQPPKLRTRDIVQRGCGMSYFRGYIYVHRPKLISWLPDSESVMLVNDNYLITNQGVVGDRSCQSLSDHMGYKGFALDWFLPELFYLTDNLGCFHLRDFCKGVAIRSIQMNHTLFNSYCVTDFSPYEHQGMTNVVLTALNQQVKVMDLSAREPVVQSFGMKQHLEGIDRILVVDEFKALTVGKDGRKLTVWDLRQTESHICSDGKLRNITSLDFNPQNKNRLVVSTCSGLHLMDLSSGQLRKLNSVDTPSGVVSLTWHQDERISTIHSAPSPGICLWKETNRRTLELVDDILAGEDSKGDIEAGVGSKSFGRAMTIGDFDFYTPSVPISNFSILSF